MRSRRKTSSIQAGENERKAKQVWQTWWSVVGPKLPQSEMRLQSNIVLAPLTQEQFDETKNFRAPVPSISTSGDYFVVHYPPRDEVQSRYKMQIDVEAEAEDEAQQIARTISHRLLTCLTLIVPGGSYHAELRKLRRLGETQEFSSWGETGSITPLSKPDDLEDREIKRTLHLINVIERDATAENAYIHLLSAWQLQSTPGSKPLERSILQHYVLCMEAVISGMMADIRTSRSDQIRLNEREFASSFAEELQSRADKPEAIRKASTKLREISLSNMLPSISAAAPLLKLSSEDLNTAKELYRFRSSNLSHPGRNNKGAYDIWLRRGPTVAQICTADRIARTFLKGYCENVLSKSK